MANKFKTKPFRTKPFRSGTFVTSWYARGGQTRDKHGNKSSSPETFRNNHSGLVITKSGRILGIERNRRHAFGSDPRKVRIGSQQTAQKKKIMLELRRRGRV